MEGIETNLNPGVEGAGDTGTDGIANQQEEINGEEVDNDVIVNDDTESDEQDTADNEPDAQADDGIETSKSFAERLRKKTEQIETQLKQQYEQQYGKAYKTIEREAKKYGITPEEYIAELEQAAQEEERAAQLEADRQKYGDLPDDIIQKIKEADVIKAQAAEQESRFKEMQEFKKNFNDVKTLDDIPDEVFAMRNQRGLTLSEAYKLYLYDHQNTEKAKIEAEQAAIKKIQQNSKSTAGNLGSAKVDTDIDFMSMKDADFEKMIQAVKMGKKIF
jgi:hypothetical protein